MKPEVRRAVAYTVGLVSGRTATSVYDFDAAKHFMFVGTADAVRVEIYDYSCGKYFGGTLPLLYHHVDASHLNLEIVGSTFSGFDHASGRHFRGKVVGARIVMFDYDTDLEHEYLV